MKIIRFFQTIRYLKLEQIFFRIYYFFYKGLSNSFHPKLETNRVNKDIFIEPIKKRNSLNEKGNFIFSYEEQNLDTVDWHQDSKELLWQFNLHYFDFLQSDNLRLSHDKKVKLIHDWILKNPVKEGVGWHPYPLSLRLVNWIKWAIINDYRDEEFIKSIFDQAYFLQSKLERHLLGNHFFSNIKALLFVSIFLDGATIKQWRARCIRFLNREILEQVNQDGGHFELSPMYHLIFLEDILDLINIAKASDYNLSNDLEKIALKMIDWIKILAHPDNSIASFNDCSQNIASTINQVIEYANKLGLKSIGPFNSKENNQLALNLESGYCRFKNEKVSFFVDIAKIGPDYLPGHGHADTLSFEASFFDEKVFVNSGTSCYKISKRREFERSTAAHNTLEINCKNSSDVWSAFRAGKRAQPFNIKKSFDKKSNSYHLSCSHNGYSSLFRPLIHKREWEFNSSTIKIIDSIEGDFKEAISRLYIHPHVDIKEVNEKSLVLRNRNGCSIYLEIENAIIKITNTKYSETFGKLIDNRCINLHLIGKSSSICIKY